MTGGSPPVLIDLVAAQSPSFRGRGIARHGLAFTRAMLRRHPELVAGVRVHPGLEGLEEVETAVPPELVVRDLEPDGPGRILHLTSVFELEIPIGELWPLAAARRRMPLVVTVYDLIPDIFPEVYLRDPGIRRLWRSAREIVRAADGVLAISDATATDVERLLGVPAPRLTMIGAGCDERFCPPADRDAARAAARLGVDGLVDRYVAYNASINPHKNVDRLIDAYALLPEAVRARWQLVIVCTLRPLERNHFLVRAAERGVEGRVLFPGFLSEEALVGLYQGADLSVFPSLYEGYGLPIVEALACGAPVVGADNSSLREVLPPAMRFNGYDPYDIAGAMARGLTDEAYRRRLLARAGEPRPTWDDVADRAAVVYERLDAAHGRTAAIRPGWPSGPRVAVVAAPDGAGPEVAAHGRRLAVALSRRVSVDLYGDGAAPRDGDGPERVGRPAVLPHVAPWRGGYDGVVVCVGSHPSFASSSALLDRLDRPVVVAYDASAAAAAPVAALAAFDDIDNSGGLARLPADEDEAAEALLASLGL